VDEVVQALVALAQCPEAVGQVVNVGSDQEIAIADLAELVKKMTGSDSPITYVPYEKAYEEGFEDMARRVPDVSKLAGLVGFTPQKNIEDIVSGVIAFYRER
jgi:UDP-glucose 4-epimerase